MKAKKKTSDAVDLMNKWYGGHEEWEQMLVEERLRVRVGQIVYNLRVNNILKYLHVNGVQ